MAPKPIWLLVVDSKNPSLSLYNPEVPLPRLFFDKVNTEVATSEGPAIKDGSIGVHVGSKQNEKQVGLTSLLLRSENDFEKTALILLQKKL
jgi:hypothetical protein